MINNKPLVWSYSLLSTYKICPRQAQAKYITKELPYVESPEAAYGNEVHKEYENALKAKQFPTKAVGGARFFHDFYGMKAKELHAEQMLGIDRDWRATGFFSDNVWGRGKADVTAIIREDTAFMFDWKTGRVREDAFELEVQAVLLKAKYPQLQTIKGCYIWLKEDRYGEVYDLGKKVEETKRAIADTVHRLEQGIFYANKNPLCSYCSLRSCKYWRDRTSAR